MKVTCYVFDNKSKAKFPTPIDIRQDYYALKPMRPGSTIIEMHWWDINMWVKEKTFDDHKELLAWMDDLKAKDTVEWVDIP